MTTGENIEHVKCLILGSGMIQSITEALTRGIRSRTGMVASTVATLEYLPFCFFNILSPLMSILIAATGYKIVKKEGQE